MRVIVAVLVLMAELAQPRWGGARLQEATPAADSLRQAPRLAEPAPPAGDARSGTVLVVNYHDAVPEHDVFTKAVPLLLEFVRGATHIEAPLAWAMASLSSPAVQSALMLCMTGQDAQVRLSQLEKEALGAYLRDGGLLFAEDVVSGGSPATPPPGAGVSGTPFDQQLKALLADPRVLGAQGRRWQTVPSGHPLYANYFLFPDGPPLSASARGNVVALEMLELRGRMAVLFSDLNLSWFWANPDAEARGRPLQLGANILVQALTHQFAGRPLPIRR